MERIENLYEIGNKYKELFKGKSIDTNRLSINENMAKHTSFRAGGNAALLVEVDKVEELAMALEVLNDNEVEHTMIGNGSNVLFKDEGYSGVVIKLGGFFSQIILLDDDVSIKAYSASLLSSMAKFALSNSLTGLEFASGIPGSVGGGVFMNAGAYDGEIKNVLESVTVLKKSGGETEVIPVSQLDLGYRHSIFQSTGDIVLSGTFKLKRGRKSDIEARMKELNEKRNTKQPVNYPSGGSFFKRPVGQFAGKLVQDAGLKGLTVGGAQVSELHSGFIINKGGATATDIIELMTLVQNTVYDKFNVRLEPEVRIIGD